MALLTSHLPESVKQRHRTLFQFVDKVLVYRTAAERNRMEIRDQSIQRAWKKRGTLFSFDAVWAHLRCPVLSSHSGSQLPLLPAFALLALCSKLSKASSQVRTLARAQFHRCLQTPCLRFVVNYQMRQVRCERSCQPLLPQGTDTWSVGLWPVRPYVCACSRG